MMHDLLTFSEAHWVAISAGFAAVASHADRAYGVVGQEGGLLGIWNTILHGSQSRTVVQTETKQTAPVNNVIEATTTGQK